MILEPNQIFRISHLINNPSDTGTYYVQAKIYNAVTRAIIDTVNLVPDSNNDQLFSAKYVAPNIDGLQIQIITTVYTDAGHTSVSPIYGYQITDYIIKHIPNQLAGGFTRGSETDYKKVEDIMRGIVKELPAPEKTEFPQFPEFPEIPKYDDESLKSLIAGNHESLEGKLAEAVKSVSEAINKSLKGYTDIISKQNEEMVSLIGDLKSVLTDLSEDMTVIDKLEEISDKFEKNHGLMMKRMDEPMEMSLGMMTATRPKYSQEKESENELINIKDDEE